MPLIRRTAPSQATLTSRRFRRDLGGASILQRLHCTCLTEQQWADVPKLQDLVELGVIGGVHGVAGFVKLLVSTDAPSQRLKAPAERCAALHCRAQRGVGNEWTTCAPWGPV